MAANSTPATDPLDSPSSTLPTTAHPKTVTPTEVPAKRTRRRYVDDGPGTAFTCPTCGATHLRTHRGQKYCGHPCRIAGWKVNVQPAATAAGAQAQAEAAREGRLPRDIGGKFAGRDLRASSSIDGPAGGTDEVESIPTVEPASDANPLPADMPLGERSRRYANLLHEGQAGAEWAARGNHWVALLDDGSRIIHLTGYGARLSVEKEQLVCRPGVTHSTERGGISQAHVLRKGQRQIEAVVIGGHRGMLSLEAIQWCCEQGVALYITNRDAQLLTVVSPPETRKVELRRLQYTADPLTIARAILLRKFAAQAWAKPELREYVEAAHREADRARTTAELQLVEGRLSQVYWMCWRDLQLTWRGKGVPSEWQRFEGRTSWNGSPRHATHPANAMLNYSYAALAGRIEREATSRGLDAAVGALHTEMDGRRNSLTYDLIEPLRPRADLMLFAWIERQAFRMADFPTDREGVVRLHPSLRKVIAQETHLPQRLITSELDHYLRLLRLRSGGPCAVRREADLMLSQNR